MKQFFLALFLATLSFSAVAQDSNWVPCPTDLYISNQGTTYTVSVYVNTPNTTWTVNGVATPNGGSAYYTFDGAVGSLYDVCVSFPCDSSIIELCETIFIDSVIVDPIDSFEMGCLVGLSAYVQGDYLSAYAEFDGEYDQTLVTWTLDGAPITNTGSSYTTILNPGTYIICAAYNTDSCSATICETIVIEESNNGNDTIILDDWINNNWDSVYVDSNVWEDLNDWDLDTWSDSLLILIFGDDINFDDLDSNIYVFLDGLTQDEIDSLFNNGLIVFGRDDLTTYWEDFLAENGGNLFGLTFNELLDLFDNFVSDAATDALGVDEIEKANIDAFFNQNTNILTVNADNIGLISVYNIQGQRMLSTTNTSELNLSSINAGMYILSIEIEGKVFSHKIVK